MDRFIIHKSSLHGTVEISGSKNACLPIMAATLLTDEECKIHNIPHLMDIITMVKILEVLGKQVRYERDTLIIKNRSKLNKVSFAAPYRLVRTMRASFCCLGPLLARKKKARVALPGGCVIGLRPVDLHIKGLKALGADLAVEKGYWVGRVKHLRGSHIYLGGPFGSSVLATANVLMAATLAEGQTLIEYAACEPEIEFLGKFLKKMGADIEGEGTPLIKIKGVKSLGGAECKVIPDRIEAGTFMAASLAAKSTIEIKGIDTSHLTPVVEVVKMMGGELKMQKGSCRLKSPSTLNPVNITTFPYPGFPTDLQAQFTACLCFAKGTSLITEKVYPDRFMHVAELNRMGASIQRSGPYAIIEGEEMLYGAEVMASDLRASAALVIAGLAAEGKTEVTRVYHIDRGYERIEEKLKKLGAKIKRESQ
ncbi:MAG: UDP-N-acetylglucosamine 1-carboxyvinyltransferase [Candidatus Omnitrophota bacterium]|nr:MAG: UDP-N-acetylglucosamine 1-carboxyvinyltransferase [Candidatus Omnitrophota bacterium]